MTQNCQNKLPLQQTNSKHKMTILGILEAGTLMQVTTIRIANDFLKDSESKCDQNSVVCKHLRKNFVFFVYFVKCVSRPFGNPK